MTTNHWSVDDERIYCEAKEQLVLMDRRRNTAISNMQERLNQVLGDGPYAVPIGARKDAIASIIYNRVAIANILSGKY